MPFVYALILSKFKEYYRKLFQNLINFNNEQNVNLQSQFVLIDFKKAAINAIHTEFQDIQNKGYHFYLTQSIYHKMQTFRLTIQYKTDKNFSLLI